MSIEIKQKHSRYGIVALLFSAPIWIYLLVIFLCRDFLWAFLIADQCKMSDYGLCGLKNLAGPILEIILAFILGVIPLVLYSISTTLGFIGYKQTTDRKTFAVAALINNGISLVCAAAAVFVLILLHSITD